MLNCTITSEQPNRPMRKNSAIQKRAFQRYVTADAGTNTAALNRRSQSG